MQKEVKYAGRLLNDEGALNECGYARKMLLEYDRSHIKANSFRIKEWDYYLIANKDFAVALTIADNSYMGLLSVSLLDFRQPWYKTTSVIKLLTFGKFKLPSSSKDGDIIYQDERVQMEFLNNGVSRKLFCYMNDFNNGKSIECEFLIHNEPRDSIVMATPFAEDRKAFYYNQKINCMKVHGAAKYDGREYRFHPNSSFAVLDWGRGVWTYKNTWYWGSASGIVDGVTLGFNIGYGFGDTSAASENVLFYDGIAHKLEEVEFHIPKNGKIYDYMKPWSFTSSDKRFEMSFRPVLDRQDYTSIWLISSDQHQVFGFFSGNAVLDDGTTIEVKDFFGFAERVSNRW